MTLLAVPLLAVPPLAVMPSLVMLEAASVKEPRRQAVASAEPLVAEVRLDWFAGQQPEVVARQPRPEMPFARLLRMLWVQYLRLET